MILLLISLVAGLVTVLTPCVLPLLPVIIGGSLSDGTVNKKKTLTIILSLAISVILFTLLLKASTLFINIPEDAWKWISGGIIFILGLITLFPGLWETKMMARLSAKSNILLGKGNTKNSFWGDVLVGGALGPVFSTCSPTYFIVLASVLPVSPVVGMIYLFAYTLGLSISLFIVVFVGQKIMKHLNIASDPKSTFKKVLGIIFILVGLAVITGYDKQLEIKLLDAGLFDATKIELKLLEKQEMSKEIDNISDKLPGNTSASLLTLQEKNKKYPTVPEISTPDDFINTNDEEISLESLRAEGKVVLLDIWTYSCINCQRTIPYLNEWYRKYESQGLEIVGLHTPEFAFEKVKANVADAVERFGIKYPVIMDNDFSTWRALGNQYWPRKYLVDIDGFIVYDHIGEGGYEETERQIQQALKERANRMAMEAEISSDIAAPSDAVVVNSRKVRSPEVYLGAWRNELLANGTPKTKGVQKLTIPSSIFFNSLYLGGTWNIEQEYAQNNTPGDIVFNYEAKNVYMVLGADQDVKLEIYQDDKLIKKITVNKKGLYTIMENDDYERHTLDIKILNPGLEAFTFTFG